jgi:hypothetical protein
MNRVKRVVVGAAAVAALGCAGLGVGAGIGNAEPWGHGPGHWGRGPGWGAPYWGPPPPPVGYGGWDGGWGPPCVSGPLGLLHVCG